MEHDFSNKSVVITGASRGIGFAAAKLFSDLGANIIALSRSDDGLESLRSELQKNDNSSKHLFLKTDLSEEGEIIHAFERIHAQFDHIDVLINNAGSFSRAPVSKMSYVSWRENFSVNIDAMFLCCREALKLIAPNKQGAIVNIGSIAGSRGVDKFPEFAGYAAAKSAVIGFTEAFAAEVKPLGIRVNAVAPGAVNTQMLKDVAADLNAKTQPEDIAKIILFFADSNMSGVVSGSVLDVFCNDFE